MVGSTTTHTSPLFTGKVARVAAQTPIGAIIRKTAKSSTGVHKCLLILVQKANRIHEWSLDPGRKRAPRPIRPSGKTVIGCSLFPEAGSHKSWRLSHAAHMWFRSLNHGDPPSSSHALLSMINEVDGKDRMKEDHAVDYRTSTYDMDEARMVRSTYVRSTYMYVFTYRYPVPYHTYLPMIVRAGQPDCKPKARSMYVRTYSSTSHVT